MQPEKFTPETKIRLLLALINDEGYEKFESGFNKLLLRLHEFYDSNTKDIIKYLTKSIINIPLKGEIYAKVLRKFNKSSITNEVFKEIVTEMQKTKNFFIHYRCIRFFICCVAYGLISEENLSSFVENLVKIKNEKLLSIIIISIVTQFDNTAKTKYLLDICEKINSSINPSSNSSVLWDLIYSTVTNKNEKRDEVMNLCCFLKITPDTDVTLEGTIENPFPEIEKISYSYITLSSLYQNFDDTPLTYENFHYRLLQMDIISSFKDNYQLCDKFLFNINTFFGFEQTLIQSSITLRLPETLLILSLDPTAPTSDVTLYASLSNKMILQNNTLESLFTTKIIDFLSKIKILDSLSAYQIDNLVIFCTFYGSNISSSKSGILNVKIDPSASNNSYYYGKCLCDKMGNLITKKNFNEITKVYDENFMKDLTEGPKIVNTSPDYEIMAENIKLKQNFNEFKSKLANKDNNSNELLINFSQCILVNRSKTLSHLREAVSFYSDAFREMESTNTDEKEYILLNSIFDVWGHSSTHLIFIIELLYNRYLLGHLNVVKFIFGEKLNQNKTNVLDWVYYAILELTIHNCFHLLDQVKNELSAEQQNLAKSDEDQRIGIIKKIEMYEGIEARLIKEKEILCEEIFNKFVSLYQAAERLGGTELKDFVGKLIRDFVGRCVVLGSVKEEVGQKTIDQLNK